MAGSEVAPALAASLRELEADFCPPVSRHAHDCLCVIEEVTCDASERNTAWICFRCWLPTTSKRDCHSDSDSEALHRPWPERQGRNSSRYVNEHSGRVDAAPEVPSRPDLLHPLRAISAQSCSSGMEEKCRPLSRRQLRFLLKLHIAGSWILRASTFCC